MTYGRHAPRRGTTSECSSCGTSSDGPTAITARSVAARRTDMAAGRTRGVHAANHVRRRSARGACTTCPCCLACHGAYCRSRSRLPRPSSRARGAKPGAVGRSTGGSRCRPSGVQRTIVAAAPTQSLRGAAGNAESVCQQYRASRDGVATTDVGGRASCGGMHRRRGPPLTRSRILVEQRHGQPG